MQYDGDSLSCIFFNANVTFKGNRAKMQKFVPTNSTISTYE